MGVTIVANEVSEETLKKLQEEVKDYATTNAMKYLARKGFRVRREGETLRCLCYK